MNKIDFKDYPNLTTQVNASNLNQMQTNIETAINSSDSNISTMQNDINNIESDITTIETNVSNLTSRVGTLEAVKGLPEYGDGYIDPDITTSHFILTQKNTPNNSFYFVFTFFFGSKTATASRTQIAIPYNYSTGTTKNTVYLRYYFNSAWTTWRLVNS